MEPSTILVLVLTAGVAALLVYFEINSRRNEPSKKQMSNLAQPALGPPKKKADRRGGSEMGKSNAA